MAKIQVGTVPPKKKKGDWRMTPKHIDISSSVCTCGYKQTVDN